MLRTLLELDGHEVVEAKDGEEAWQLCVECQPSVVVADIQMPLIDGLQLCRKIRASQYSPDIRVIVYRPAWRLRKKPARLAVMSTS